MRGKNLSFENWYDCLLLSTVLYNILPGGWWASWYFAVISVIIDPMLDKIYLHQIKEDNFNSNQNGIFCFSEEVIL